MSNKTILNSFIYDFKWIILERYFKIITWFKKIIVKIWNKFYLFWANTTDFSDEEIKEVYKNEQIYLNTKLTKVSFDFLNDYKKLKKKWFYFEIDNKNLFIESENKIKTILSNIFIWNCLDVWCWNTLYKDIFSRKKY